MSRIVRPSGSVIVFCYNPGFVLAETAGFTPPSLKVLIDTTRLYGGIFTPFRTPGNGHTFKLYDALPGPDEVTGGWEPARRWRWGWRGKEDYGAVGDWDWDVQPATEGGGEIERAMESEISLADVIPLSTSATAIQTADRSIPSSAAHSVLCLGLAYPQIPSHARSWRPGLDRRPAGRRCG